MLFQGVVSFSIEFHVSTLQPDISDDSHSIASPVELKSWLIYIYVVCTYLISLLNLSNFSLNKELSASCPWFILFDHGSYRALFR